MFDQRLVAGDFGDDQPLIRFQHLHRLGRRMLVQISEDPGDALVGEHAFVEAQLEELAGQVLDIFGGSGHARKVEALDLGQLAGGRVVEAGAIEFGQLAGEHALGRDDDQAGDFDAGFGQHLLLFEFNGGLGLGDRGVRLLDRLLHLLVGKLFGGLLGLFDELLTLELSFVDARLGDLLGFFQLGLGVSSAFFRPSSILR